MGSLALAMMFTALLASAVFHSVLVAGQQRLDRMDQRVERRQQVLSRARLRVAELSSPSRVVAAAKRSGMVLPAKTTWLAAKAPTTAAPALPSPRALPPATGQPAAPGAELAGRGDPSTASPATRRVR